MSPTQRPEEDVITAEKATYSSLTLHRRCPQAWKYRYIDGLRRSRSELTPALDFGSWFHAVRALDRITKGVAEGTLKAHPAEIQTTDTGPTFPWDASPSDVMAAAVDYWDRLGEDAREVWIDWLGQPLPQRLSHVYAEWRERWAEESDNESVLAVEQRWEREIPGTGVTLWGYADEVYQDRKRGIVVVRDCKTSGTLGQVTSLDEMMDSQVQLYAWGLAPDCAEWNLPAPRAVAFDRVRSKAPKTPKITKAGKLSSSVKDYDLRTYLEWCAEGVPFEGMKKDGSAAGTYTAEESEIERLTSPGRIAVVRQAPDPGEPVPRALAPPGRGRHLLGHLPDASPRRPSGRGPAQLWEGGVPVLRVRRPVPGADGRRAWRRVRAGGVRPPLP